eukprot:TRINITY_DN4867_c0_g1_i6.p1 TRINITY_DN4867_c0_g1~~TRINITY_DN4867_c0_g1_i6.p1  ORF type:complete len:835 (+),score=193.28 TRINITY_DN4867_c0_g1_i6:114-2507(+)
MNSKRIVEMDSKTGGVKIHPPKGSGDTNPKTFTFDACYDSNSTQESVFVETAQPIVDSVLEGYNGTIFAYGQTGTGKTFTMEGVSEPKELRGIIPRSFQYIFDMIDHASDAKKKFLVRASYLEIYNEEIRDLLGNDPMKKLELKESADTGVYVKDLSGFVVKSKSEIETLMAKGHKNRTVGATMMNAESSRSHSIFTILIESAEESALDGKEHIKQGKLNLVDLAGSERANKTGATGERLKEGCKINLSLSALGNVISALVDGKSHHIPYRDSKLTRLLQDSLGGNARTVMVANMSPAEYNFDETLSTLRYANRAKNIKNKPKINEDPKDALLREFQSEIERLRKQLEEMASKGGQQSDSPASSPVSRSDGNARPSSGKSRSRRTEEQPQPEVKYVVDEALMQDLQQKSQEEIKALMDQKNMAEEDRQRVQAELAQRQAALEQEKQMRESLQNKLKELETNLIEGGVHVMDKVKIQERELQRAQQIMLEKQREEERLRQELEEKEMARLMVQESYANVQEEVESKTRKLKKAVQKIASMAQDMEEQQEIFAQEREELTDSLRSVTNELDLARMIIESFIPPEDVEKIKRKAVWDEERSQWFIPRIEKTGIQHIPRPTLSRRSQMLSVSTVRRKNTEAAKIQAGLDYPERTTRDPQNPTAMSFVENARLRVGVDPIPIPSEPLSLIYHSYNHPDYGQVQTSEAEVHERPSSARGDRRSRPSSASRNRPSSSLGNRQTVDDSYTIPSSSSGGNTSRPSSARRSSSRGPVMVERKQAVVNVEEVEPANEYPTARGLVRRS